MRKTASASHSAQAARMTGCAPGAQTTTSPTPAARAVTTPMTTVDGYGAAAAGTGDGAVRRAAARNVERRAAHGHLAQADDLAGREQHLALVVAPGDGHLADVGDRHL